MKTEAYADYLERAAGPREAATPEARDVRDARDMRDTRNARDGTRAAPAGRVVDLDLAGPGNYVRRRGVLIEAMWFVIEAAIISNKLIPFSGLRAGLLRLFGARIGRRCRLLHPIRVKSPWNLEVGDSCWFGMDVWIYNQAPVRIGSNVCISQGSFLTAGSHALDGNMDLQVAPIVIEDGVWITAGCVVQKGITIGRSAVVTPLSVVHRSLEPEGIYGGNPCRFIRKRFGAPADMSEADAPGMR